MLFNSLEFLFGFLPIAYSVFWWLKTCRSRYIWLAVTGYVFYAFWDPRFVLLMAFSTAVSYLAGLGFLNASRPNARKLLLVIPIAIDLSLLGFFKYSNFLLQSIEQLAASFGSNVRLPVLEIILPVGISFYTFHTITYIVDSYRGTIRPTRNLFEFAAYVSLFSQLVAGPIVRFRQIEKDLEELEQAGRTRWMRLGIAYFLIGMLEKVLVADTLAAWVDPAFANADALSSGEAWLSASCYSLQLYYDFCGYSDMAIGLGLLFGIRIPVNFNSPYQSLSPADFWRRWHISLSTCMRDYLYIPLGGNRGTVSSTNRNLLLTMLIGGLWHGANWTFVVWGLYHGLLLIAYRATSTYWDRLPALMRQIAMFVLVTVGWVYFRADSIESANHLCLRMFRPTSGGDLASWMPLMPMLIGAIAWSMFGKNAQELLRGYEQQRWHDLVFAGAFGVCVALIIGGGESPFLYFQF